MDPLRTFHTVRHLGPGQVFHRLTRRLRRIPPAGALDAASYRLRPRPPEPRAPGGARAFDGAAFTFLNRRLPFTGEGRWRPPGVSPLWHYKLHYFQYLDELEPARAAELMVDWIESNPAPHGVGWQPYPLSMRIREWIEWILARDELAGDLRRGLVASVVHQTAALEAQIEFEHRANHLLENAITLCWAGSSLVGPGAGRWLARGAEILEAELDTQLLADGTHDERSPMYQAWIAEALLRLGGVLSAGAGDRQPGLARLCRRAGGAMLRALADLTHPDGDYALVNDTAFDQAPRRRDLERRFATPGESDREPAPGPWDLPAAGYMGLRDAGGGYLIFDAGDIAPDHNTAHAHADTLSFELSRGGRRLVTDTGVYTYCRGPVREYDRGTAAHNTVEINGRDQSEVWASHRCGRRARIRRRRLRAAAGQVLLEGGYRGPSGRFSRLSHLRRIAARAGELAFEDLITAAGKNRCTLRLHLAPGLGARRADGAVEVTDGGGRRLLAIVGGGFEWDLGSSPYHPSFGVEEDRICLSSSRAFEGRTAIGWRIRL